jgi:hypothetical protein
MDEMALRAKQRAEQFTAERMLNETFSLLTSAPGIS